MLLHHLMTKRGSQRGEQLKEMAQCREDWHRWSTESAQSKAPEERMQPM